MEEKLAVYQLAAPCTSCRSMAGPKLDKVIDGGQKIFNLVGSAADLADKIAKVGRDEKVTLVNPQTGTQQTMTAAQAQSLISSAQSNTNGSNEMMMMFMAKMLEKMDDKNGGNSHPEKDNTGLYIGLGVGGLIFITLIMFMMNKK